MLATISFFWSMLDVWFSCWDLPEPTRQWMRQEYLEQKGQICADLFQWSSSCVEGRNGQLSLKHHALHRFTLPKLQALTVLHNYLDRRPDGTTAAERFYGTAPQDLFGWLLNRVPVPARPRCRRRAS